MIRLYLKKVKYLRDGIGIVAWGSGFRVWGLGAHVLQVIVETLGWLFKPILGFRALP